MTLKQSKQLAMSHLSSRIMYFESKGCFERARLITEIRDTIRDKKNTQEEYEILMNVGDEVYIGKSFPKKCLICYNGVA